MLNMDQESVQSTRSEKSDRGHTHIQQPQSFPVALSESMQQMSFPPAATNGCLYPHDDIRNHPEMQGIGIPLGQQPIYHPQGHPQQHPNYPPAWNNPQPPRNAPYLPYSPPNMFPPQQCMNMMAWSGQQMGVCGPTAAYPMQPIPPSSNQSFPPAQLNQPLLPLEQTLVPKMQPGPMSSVHTPASSHHGANQQIEPYCSHVQDENAWVENATAVTGATSETGLSADNMSRYGTRYGLLASLGLNSGPNSCVGGAAAALIRTEIDDFHAHACARLFSFCVYFGLGLCSVFSPVLMVVFPYLPLVGWATDSCEPTCEGHLIGMAVKLALLALGTWILTTPHCPFINGGYIVLLRIRLWRSLLFCLIFVVLFAFWLFYSVRILQPKEKAYGSIVLFSSSLSDTLLFLNYAGIALLEFQRMRSQFAVHIVRSPDGASKTYRIGGMSIERAALEILQLYMVDFTVYTQPASTSSNRRGKRSTAAAAEIVSASGPDSGGGGDGRGSGSKYKFYDVDSRGGGGGGDKQGSGGGAGGGGGTQQAATTGHTGPSASARLYDEMETEKRVRKRRMRLLLAVEDAFAHASRMAKDARALATPAARGSLGGDRMGQSPYRNGNGNLRLPRELVGHTDACKRFDPYEAAQTVFPTLIRPLQKYMRATRQQSRHPVDSVIDHLAMCLTYGLSPLTFMERFNPFASTPQQDAATAASALTVARSIAQRHRRPLTIAGPTDAEGAPYKPPQAVSPGGQQVWQIVSDRALSRDIADGVVFLLKRRHGNCEISLLCTVQRLPLLQLLEGTLDLLQDGPTFSSGPRSRVVA